MLLLRFKLLLLLFTMELLLCLLLLESVVHWWSFELSMIFLLFLVEKALRVLRLRLVLWPELVLVLPLIHLRLILVISLMLLLHLSFLDGLPALVLRHARLDGLSHHFLLFSGLVLPFSVESLTLCECSFHEGLLLVAVSFLSHSQGFLELLVV